MKLAIMQPYWFPYIGYWQLINAADVFVLYDNIQYTKKGWINRNRFLQNGKYETFTIPLVKDSSYLDICKRKVSDIYDRKKILSQLENAYSKAPYRKEIMPLLNKIINFEENNLFKYIHNSIVELTKYMDIDTNLLISSSLDIDHNLKKQDKVIGICKYLNADTYINPIGGIELYNDKDFKKSGIELKFLQPGYVEYKQFDNDFVPWLSIIDVLMFNELNSIRNMLNKFSLIAGNIYE